MRKKAREITDFSEILAVIAKCDTVRIAMFDEKYPYIVPLNFGEKISEEGELVLYLHCANAGKKLDLLRRNPNVAFEMDCGHELCYREETQSCSFRYESVMGVGRIDFVPDEEKELALSVLMSHYHSSPVPFNSQPIPATTCLKLTVLECTGKRSRQEDYMAVPFKGNESNSRK